MVIYTGLDWSGSPGDPQKVPGANPWLVLVAVHIDEAALPELRSALAEAKIGLRLPPDYPFKHLASSARTRTAFFAAIRRLPLAVHANLIDTRDWDATYLKQSRGPDRIADGVIDLILGCPDQIIAGQTLLVDLPRRELRIVRDLRTAIRMALRGVGRRSFATVQPCPDHRDFGVIVQVADMVAGELREHASVTGPYLAAIQSKIDLVR